MEEKLVLGLPDVAASIAPKNRFEVPDKPAPRYWRLMTPALVVAALGAFLGKLHSETQQPRQQDSYNPVEDASVPEAEVEMAGAVTGFDIIQQVAEYLRQVAEEAGNPARKIRFSGEAASMPSSFHARVNMGLDDSAVRSFSPRRSANDNREMNDLFKPLTPLGTRRDVADGGGTGGTDPGPGESGPPNNNGGPGADPGNNGRPNRLPVVAGKVMLGSGLMNLSALIMLDNLASAATDADGDALSIRNLSVSSGEIRTYGNGAWLYTPERGYTGEVTFTYGISDGKGSVSASALFDLFKGPAHQISGTEHDDVLLGTPEDDIIAALGGDDIVYGRESDDVIYGGDGDDTLMGGDGNDILYGDAGHDRMFGGHGDDILFGGDGNDEMYGEEGDDILIAGNGNDVAGGGIGNDHIFGEAGHDTLSGEAGNDLLDGGDGDDSLSGGTGNDAIIGGAGDDIVIAGFGIEEARAATGPAQVAVSDGDDTYSGGEGFDTYDASGASDDVVINLATKTASGSRIGTDSIDGFEAVIGGSGDDTLNGDGGDNLLIGNAGDDRLTGDNGDDTVLAGAGNDTVVVLYSSSGSSDGDDHYSGGGGVATYDASAAMSVVLIDLAVGTAQGVEIGSDHLEGFEAAIAGLGDDVLVANSQINFLTGGAGNDVFIFRSAESVSNNGQGTDKILDFRIGDRIDLSDLADEIGGLMFDRIMDEIDDQQDIKRIRLYSEFDDGENTIVRAVIDLADEREDLELLIYGHQALTEDDFILAVRDDDAGMARA
jgi:Ca2+-binding RTX toxin-like protein